MKIGFSAVGPNLDSLIDARFGRCQYILISDKKGKLKEVLTNPGIDAMRGAGIAAAQTIVSQGVEVLITGNIGPNAFLVLQSAGVRVYSGVFGLTVKQALNKYKQGELKEVEAPTVPSPLGRGGRGRGRGRGGPGRV